MEEKNLFNCTKLAAYFLWEATNNTNALGLWYCVEDIACFFEQSHCCTPESVAAIIRKGTRDDAYIAFVRHVAYRIYKHTENPDPLVNWLLAERMLSASSWVREITHIAALLNAGRGSPSPELRSDAIRAYYEQQTFS